VRTLLLAIALLMIAPVVSLAAGDHGFQIELDAVGSLPTGTYEFGGLANELYLFGGNGMAKALFGISRGLSIGICAGYLESHKDFTRTTVFDTRPPRNISGTRSLHSIPVLALVQARTDTHRRLSWYGEGGFGLTTFQVRLSELSGGRQPVSDFQRGFSYMADAGACLGLGRTLELIAGAGYLQSFTRAGEAWESGDNPAHVLCSLGLRYPRW
jgi:hypothetical protein